MTPRVGALHVYPVKSCRGIDLAQATLAERGVVHDREWMIVERDADPALFVTQREVPTLALIETAFVEDGLLLRAPDMDETFVRFDFAGPARRVVVWRDTVTAIDQGEPIARWLSDFVGIDVRLVRFDPREHRVCNRVFAGDSGAHTQFADGYPVLVIGRASLDDLNDRLAQRGVGPLPMNRFRPNLVLDGLEPYDEDHISALKIGNLSLRFVKPCTRCQITTTNQATAEVAEEPLRIFAGYRNHPQLGGVTFGMNAIVTEGAGTSISIGDEAEVDWSF